MFRNFTRPSDVSQAKVVPLGAAQANRAATSGPSSPADYVTSEERELVKRLERAQTHDFVQELLHDGLELGGRERVVVN